MRSFAPRTLALFVFALTAFMALPVQRSDGQRSRTVRSHPPRPVAFCDQLKALTLDPAVAQAHWGIMVADLNGVPLCSLNPAQLFRPASNAKLFTASAALALLGAAKSYTTSIVAEPGSATPSADASELRGNLRIVGAGDAFLSRRPVPYAAEASPVAAPPDPLAVMADAIVASGLRHITGSVIGDDSAWPFEPYAPDWSIDDAVWGYGASVSALSVYDNKMQFTISPGASVGAAGSVSFASPTSFSASEKPFLKLDLEVNTAAAKTPPSLSVERLPASDTLRVAGSVALGGTYSDDIAIPDPARYAALALSSMLKTRGVQIDGPSVALHRESTMSEGFAHQVQRPLPMLELASAARVAPSCAGCRTLATHVSATLLDDVTITLKVSQNLHAELLLHHLAEAFGDDGSIAQGVRVVRQFAVNAGVKPGDVVLFDGSGLSGHDLVTPGALVQLLVYDARQPWFAGFKAALPVGGTDGSLAVRFTAPNSILKGQVFAKTGTLGESRALSGYLTAASGRTLVFSILVDDHPPASSADRNLTDKMVEIIAAAN